MNPKQEQSAAEKKSGFEQSLARLEQIVKQLEEGNSPLEESLALFDEGTALVKLCGQLIDAAEQKVRMLTEKDGEVALSDFPAGNA